MRDALKRLDGCKMKLIRLIVACVVIFGCGGCGDNAAKYDEGVRAAKIGFSKDLNAARYAGDVAKEMKIIEDWKWLEQVEGEERFRICEPFTFEKIAPDDQRTFSVVLRTMLPSTGEMKAAHFCYIYSSLWIVKPVSAPNGLVKGALKLKKVGVTNG